MFRRSFLKALSAVFALPLFSWASPAKPEFVNDCVYRGGFESVTENFAWRSEEEYEHAKQNGADKEYVTVTQRFISRYRVKRVVGDDAYVIISEYWLPQRTFTSSDTRDWGKSSIRNNAGILSKRQFEQLAAGRTPDNEICVTISVGYLRQHGLMGFVERGGA